MNIFINSIIKWADSGRSERVLCLHPAGLHYYCMDITAKNAWPLLRLCADVEAALKESRAVILEHDELAMYLRAENALTDQQRRLRDRAWEAIRYLVSDEQRTVMDRRHSERLIGAAAQHAALHTSTIYKYLRRYWQRGQTIQALQPNFPGFDDLTPKRPQSNGGLSQPEAEEHSCGQNDESLINSAAASSRGIGDVYQVDVTIADVRVVHSKKRNTVSGRPVIYLVIDVFSNLVVGVHITFGNARRSGAYDALLFAISEKDRSCADHAGFGINRRDWPAKGLPRAILSDPDSAFPGEQFYEFAKVLGIQVKPAPAYAPSTTTVSERLTRFLQPALKWLAAVALAGEIVRGDENFGPDVCMTEKEFEGAILRAILEYNARYLDRYSPTPDMIKDDVELSPRSIWKWGLIKANYLRYTDESQMDLARRISRETSVRSSGSATRTRLTDVMQRSTALGRRSHPAPRNP